MQKEDGEWMKFHSSPFFTRPILPDRCRNRNFWDYCFTDTHLIGGPGVRPYKK